MKVIPTTQKCATSFFIVRSSLLLACLQFIPPSPGSQAVQRNPLLPHPLFVPPYPFVSQVSRPCRSGSFLQVLLLPLTLSLKCSHLQSIILMNHLLLLSSESYLMPDCWCHHGDCEAQRNNYWSTGQTLSFISINRVFSLHFSLCVTTSTLYFPPFLGCQRFLHHSL